MLIELITAKKVKLSVFLVFKARVCGDFPVLAHRSPVSPITMGKAKPMWCHTHQHCLCSQNGETDVPHFRFKLTESITEVTTSGYFFFTVDWYQLLVSAWRLPAKCRAGKWGAQVANGRSDRHSVGPCKTVCGISLPKTYLWQPTQTLHLQCMFTR